MLPRQASCVLLWELFVCGCGCDSAVNATSASGIKARGLISGIGGRSDPLITSPNILSDAERVEWWKVLVAKVLVFECCGCKCKNLVLSSTPMRISILVASRGIGALNLF